MRRSSYKPVGVAVLLLATLILAAGCGGRDTGVLGINENVAAQPAGATLNANHPDLGITSGDFRVVRSNDAGDRDNALNGTLELQSSAGSDTTVVEVAIRDTTPMYGVTLELYYDPGKYNPQSVEFAGLVDTPVELSSLAVNGLVAAGQVGIHGPAQRSGEFMTVVFANQPSTIETKTVSAVHPFPLDQAYQPAGVTTGAAGWEYTEPTGPGESGMYKLRATWAVGDGNSDGETGVADLTPIISHGYFEGDPVSDTNYAPATADYNADGLVTVADITPLGQNFGDFYNGIEIAIGDSEATATTTLATLALTDSEELTLPAADGTTNWDAIFRTWNGEVSDADIQANVDGEGQYWLAARLTDGTSSGDWSVFGPFSAGPAGPAVTAYYVPDSSPYDAGNATEWDAIAGTDIQTTGNPSTGGHGPVGSDLPLVNVKAVHDGTNFAMRFAWEDTSDDETGSYWTNDAGDWSRGGSEDRLYVMWETGDPAVVGRMGLTFTQAGCAMTCHTRDGSDVIPDTTTPLFNCNYCHTEAPGNTDASFAHLDPGSLSCDTCHADYSQNINSADMCSPGAGATYDVWHWRSGRSNPLGIVEDSYLPQASRRTRDESNLAPSGNSIDSASVGGSIPLYVFTDNRPDGATSYLFQSQLASMLADDTLAMWDEENGGGPGYYLSDGTTVFMPADGATVPRSILDDVDVDSDRTGNTKANGAWASDDWVVVVYRTMAPGETDGTDPTDKDFAAGQTYTFSLAVTNNSGITHRGSNLQTMMFEAVP